LLDRYGMRFVNGMHDDRFFSTCRNGQGNGIGSDFGFSVFQFSGETIKRLKPLSFNYLRGKRAMVNNLRRVPVPVVLSWGIGKRFPVLFDSVSGIGFSRLCGREIFSDVAFHGSNFPCADLLQFLGRASGLSGK